MDRAGRISFYLYDAPDTDYSTPYDGPNPAYASIMSFSAGTRYLQLIPQFGGGKGETSRHLDGGWLPRPVTAIMENGVKYQQRTYVAPLDEKPPDGSNSRRRKNTAETRGKCNLALLAFRKRRAMYIGALTVRFAQHFARFCDASTCWLKPPFAGNGWPDGCPRWYRPRAVCVSDYTIENTLADEAG